MERNRLANGIVAGIVAVTCFLFYQVIFGLKDWKSNVLFSLWLISVCLLFILQKKEKPANKRVYRVYSTWILVLANLLWLILARGTNFHYDEAYSIGMINRNWADIIRVTSYDVHSPFYYFGLKAFFLALGGKLYQSAKVFSLLFMDAYLILGGRALRKLYDEEIVCYWLTFSCFMPPMMIHATNARMYSMALFFVTLGCIHLILWYGNGEKKDWLLFTVLFCCAVYSHTFVLLESFLIYAFTLLMVILKKRKDRLLGILVSGIVVVLAYLPWLNVLLQQFIRRSEAGGGDNVSYLRDASSAVMQYLGEWFSAMENPSVLQILFGVFVLIFLSFGVREYWKDTGDAIPFLGICIAGVTVTMAVWVSMGIVPCFLGRYIMPLFGGLWLFAAIGMSRLKENWWVLVIISCVLVSGIATFRSEKALEDPEGLIRFEQYLEEHDDEGAVVIADNYHLAMLSIFLPDARNMVYGYAPSYQAFENVEVFKDWEQLQDVGVVYYVSFYGKKGGNIEEKYKIVDSMRFQYSYYDIVVERYVRK